MQKDHGRSRGDDGCFQKMFSKETRGSMIANSDPQRRVHSGVFQVQTNLDRGLTALVAPVRRPRPRRGRLWALWLVNGASYRCLLGPDPQQSPERDGTRVSSTASHIVPIEWLPKVQTHDSLLRMKRTALSTVQVTQPSHKPTSEMS